MWEERQWKHRFNKENILVIEDDQELNEAIVLALENDTYTFIQCRTIADARKIMESGTSL